MKTSEKLLVIGGGGLALFGLAAVAIRRYPISITFMVYHGGDERLEPALNGTIAWIEGASRFRVNSTIVYSSLEPDMSEYDGVPQLSPQDIDWAEVPLSEWVVLLWKCRNLDPCPWAAGARWAITDWRNIGWPFMVISACYDPWWNCWQPFEGFSTWLEQVIAHEWSNSLVSWLEIYGHNILSTYPNEHFINCGDYANYNRCYRMLLRQVTTEMYQDMASIPLPS